MVLCERRYELPYVAIGIMGSFTDFHIVVVKVLIYWHDFLVVLVISNYVNVPGADLVKLGVKMVFMYVIGQQTQVPKRGIHYVDV